MKAVIALGALLLLGCGNDCPQAPCNSYVQINFSAALTASGRYQVDVVADGKPMQCVVHVPARDDDLCDDDLGWVRAEDQGGGGAGGTSPGDGGIVGIGLIGVYDLVAIDVTHASDALGSDTFAPEYGRDDSCGGCPMAEHDLRLALD